MKPDCRNMQHKLGKRLVLFPFPFVGHQNPMLELANILHSKGFSISIIHTHFHLPNTAKYPHFSFNLIDDGLSETEASYAELIAIFKLLNEKCAESFRVCLSLILTNGLDHDPVTCLITDSVWHFSQAVANALNVPRIVLRAGSMTSTTVITDCGRLNLRDVRRPTTYQTPLQDLILNMRRATVASRGLIVNSFKEIEDSSLTILQQEFPVPIFPIGPFHKWLPSSSISLSAQDESILSWLNNQAPNSVLYVSFGSLAAIDETAFLEMAWGLANSNQPFLWVIRSDLVHSSDGSSQLPTEFLQEVSGRAHIVGWAPQKEVLAHPAVGGFWTHCGWNSTLESICEGVPMICSPSFHDQIMNTQYVIEVWKIGLRLEKGSKRYAVEEAISKLMTTKEGEEMTERASSLKNDAFNCIQPGGSSYKSMLNLVNLIMSF